MYYRQSIVLFGFVVPLVICAAVIGGGSVLKSKAAASFAEKQSLYKNSENDRLGALFVNHYLRRVAARRLNP